MWKTARTVHCLTNLEPEAWEVRPLESAAPHLPALAAFRPFGFDGREDRYKAVVRGGILLYDMEEVTPEALREVREPRSVIRFYEVGRVGVHDGLAPQCDDLIRGVAG